MVESCGWDSLECKTQNRKWSLEEKLQLIQEVLEGQSYISVSISNGISCGMLYGWVREYKLYGNEGLTRKQGRPTKEHVVNEKQTPLTESERGILQSMSRKGNCYDNCVMETFFGRLKNEMFYGHEKEFNSFEKFKKAIAKYIDYYNNSRIQSKTKWLPPTVYREASIC